MNPYGLARIALAGGALGAAGLSGLGGMYYAGRKIRKGGKVARARGRGYRFKNVTYGKKKGMFKTTDRELKNFDTAFDDSVMATTWATSPSLVLIPQGATATTRLGRKCIIRRITTKLHVFAITQTAPFHDSGHIRLILDTQANGAVPAVTTILVSGTDDQTFNNLASRGRFITLWSRTFQIHSTSGAGNGTSDQFGGQEYEVVISQTVNFPMEYTGSSGAVTEISSNNVFLLSQSAHGLVGFRSNTRVRFTG